MMVLNNFGKIMALALRKLHWLLWKLYKYVTTGARATGHMVGSVAGMAGQAAGKAVTSLHNRVHRHPNSSSDLGKVASEASPTSSTAKRPSDTGSVQEDSKLLGPGAPTASEASTSPGSSLITETPPEEHKTEEDFNPSPLFPIIVVICFILFGAWMYTQWESWTYFESVYFIFISLSTIGLGDIIPEHPKYFMAACLYLFFGLTLVSFFINTVLLQIQKVAKKAKQETGRIMDMGRRHLRKPEGAVKEKQPITEEPAMV